jgi:hypothetical protein
VQTADHFTAALIRVAVQIGVEITIDQRYFMMGREFDMF